MCECEYEREYECEFCGIECGDTLYKVDNQIMCEDCYDLYDKYGLEYLVCYNFRRLLPYDWSDENV